MSRTVPPCRSGSPWRWIAVATTVSVLASSCGGSESSDGPIGGDPADVNERPSTTTTAPATGRTPTPSTDAPTTAPEPGPAPTNESDSDNSSPAATPYPAPALPIARAFEFAQPIWSPVPDGDGLLLASQVKVLRLDVDTGAVSELLLAQPSEFRSDPFYLTRAGPNVVVGAVSHGYSTVDLLITVDPDALERTAAVSAPLGESLIALGGTGADESNDDTTLLAVRDFNAREPLEVLDSETGDMLGETPATFYPNSLIERIDDEFWVWNDDGQGRVLTADGGDVVATLDAGRLLGGSAVVVVDRDSVWLASQPEAVLMRFDRTSYEKTNEVDLSDRYGPDVAVSLLHVSYENRFVLVQVQTPEDGWFVLVELDPATGLVRSEHVIATTSREYGWTAGDIPFVATIGDRVFVRDHLRRIVEVDVSRLGDNTGSWAAADLSPVPELTDQEREIAQLMLDVVDPAIAVPVTNEEYDELGGGVLRALPEAGEANWDPSFVVIDGDRAWGALRASATGTGLPLTFSRIDGLWHLESIGLCYLVLDFGADVCNLLG